jgi:hypothetical protein
MSGRSSTAFQLVLGGTLALGTFGCCRPSPNVPAACGPDATALRRVEKPRSQQHGVGAFMLRYRSSVQPIEDSVPSVCQVSSSEKWGSWRGYWVIERSRQFFLRAVEVSIAGEISLDTELSISHTVAEEICGVFGALVDRASSGACPWLPRGGRWLVVSVNNGHDTAYGGTEVSIEACTAGRNFDSLSAWFQEQREGRLTGQAKLVLRGKRCSARDLPKL